MEIEGYKWITGKVIARSWGTEYRYTVEKDGEHINDIVMIPDEKTSEADIIKLITAKLKQIDVAPDIPISPEEEKEKEIEAFLVVKGLLEDGQNYQEIKSKAEILAEDIQWQQ